MRMWLAMLIGAAVFIGCGIFFAFQDLGTANEYASIASFFLALLTTVGSLLSLARARSGNRATERQEENQQRRRRWTLIAWRNGIVQQGAHNVSDLNFWATPSQEEKKRKFGFIARR